MLTIHKLNIKSNFFYLKNLYKTPPPYEKLVGDLTGFYSRRINIQHRLVYQIYDDIKTLKVIRMWTHYK
ncbi:MAG: Txe/YoeB family addiction module toxin [Bacteroidetes bacterium]|nr:Txe/YoeB family addiction module toxin [Bacteroidota bacterium]MCH8170720.1 Txe/YoeB family addiction module toxin [Bacteroidota bacterium]